MAMVPMYQEDVVEMIDPIYELGYTYKSMFLPQLLRAIRGDSRRAKYFIFMMNAYSLWINIPGILSYQMYELANKFLADEENEDGEEWTLPPEEEEEIDDEEVDEEIDEELVDEILESENEEEENDAQQEEEYESSDSGAELDDVENDKEMLITRSLLGNEEFLEPKMSVAEVKVLQDILRHRFTGPLEERFNVVELTDGEKNEIEATLQSNVSDVRKIRTVAPLVLSVLAKQTGQWYSNHPNIVFFEKLIKDIIKHLIETMGLFDFLRSFSLVLLPNLVLMTTVDAVFFRNLTHEQLPYAARIKMFEEGMDEQEAIRYLRPYIKRKNILLTMRSFIMRHAIQTIWSEEGIEALSEARHLLNDHAMKTVTSREILLHCKAQGTHLAGLNMPVLFVQGMRILQRKLHKALCIIGDDQPVVASAIDLALTRTFEIHPESMEGIGTTLHQRIITQDPAWEIANWVQTVLSLLRGDGLRRDFIIVITRLFLARLCHWTKRWKKSEVAVVKILRRIDNASTLKMLELFPLINQWIDVENCLIQAANWDRIRLMNIRQQNVHQPAENPRQRAQIIISANILPRIKSYWSSVMMQPFVIKVLSKATDRSGIVDEGKFLNLFKKMMVQEKFTLLEALRKLLFDDSNIARDRLGENIYNRLKANYDALHNQGVQFISNDFVMLPDDTDSEDDENSEDELRHRLVQADMDDDDRQNLSNNNDNDIIFVDIIGGFEHLEVQEIGEEPVVQENNNNDPNLHNDEPMEIEQEIIEENHNDGDAINDPQHDYLVSLDTGLSNETIQEVNRIINPINGNGDINTDTNVGLMLAVHVGTNAATFPPNIGTVEELERAEEINETVQDCINPDNDNRR